MKDVNSLLEQRKLSNFDEKTAKKFLKKNRKHAVIIQFFIDDYGETGFVSGSADLHSRECVEEILWFKDYCLRRYLSFRFLKKYKRFHLCKNYDEAMKLYAEWCNMPSTINMQRLKNAKHHKQVLSW